MKNTIIILKTNLVIKMKNIQKKEKIIIYKLLEKGINIKKYLINNKYQN